MRLWLPVLMLATLPAFADEVTLKNGDKLTGKVVGMTDGKLKFETSHSGVLSIDWAQIASLKTDDKVRVKLATGERVEGKVTADAGRLKVASEGTAAPVEIEMGKIATFNEPPVQWHGSVDGSARTTDGNTHTSGAILTAEAV